MTLRQLKKHLRLLAYQCGYHAGKHRLDKYRDRSIGRQMAYQNALELLEQLDFETADKGKTQ